MTRWEGSTPTALPAADHQPRPAEPITVEQVIDHDTWCVQVTFNNTLTVTLTPAQAAVVESALYYAVGEPERCTYDENFATVTVDGTPVCAAHAHALDLVDLIDREA